MFVIPFSFYQPNAPTGDGTNFVFSSSGDTNGLFYYLGTNGYTTSFSNPSLSTITASASSIQFLGTPADKVTDRTTDFCHTQSESNAWIKIDLGATRTFTPNYYSVRNRSDDSSNNLNDWILQGSNNDSTWTDLNTQVGNIFGQGNWFSTAVVGVSTSYRYFRILQQGINSSGGLFLVLAELEIYGTLTIV